MTGLQRRSGKATLLRREDALYLERLRLEGVRDAGP